MESERKISLSFWITFASSERCALGVSKVKPFFCLNAFTQENWVMSYFKPMFHSCKNNLFDLRDKLTDWGSIRW